MNNKLTIREQDTLDFILSYLKRNGYSPSIREIAQGIYTTSTTSVKRNLEGLERKGYIKHTKGVSRSIVILKVR